MLAQYIEVETKKEEVKPVTQVHFDSDYDITDVLTRWGNWARKDAYLQRKAFSLYKSEHESKESLSDDDALFVDAAVTELGKLKLLKSQYEHKVLTLYYFGEISVIDDTVMIVTQSLRAIAKKLDLNKDQVSSFKSSGESCIIGMLAQQTLLTGTDMEILNNIRILK